VTADFTPVNGFDGINTKKLKKSYGLSLFQQDGIPVCCCKKNYRHCILFFVSAAKRNRGERRLLCFVNTRSVISPVPVMHDAAGACALEARRWSASPFLDFIDFTQQQRRKITIGWEFWKLGIF